MQANTLSKGNMNVTVIRQSSEEIELAWTKLGSKEVKGYMIKYQGETDLKEKVFTATRSTNTGCLRGNFGSNQI